MIPRERRGILRRVWDRRWTALKLVVGLGLFALVAAQVDWSQFWGLVTSAHPAWLAGAVVLVAGDRVFMALKWRYLLGAMRLDISLLSAVQHYLVGGLVGIAVQWQLGGDIARATRASRHTGERRIVVGSILLEKLVGVAALSALAVIAFFLLNFRLDLVSPVPLGLATAVVAPAILASPSLLVSERMTERLAAIGRKAPISRVADLSERIPELREAFDDLETSLAVFTGLTFAEQFVPVLSLFLLTHAFGQGVSLLVALSVMPVVSLLSRLPLSIESIGIKEGLYVFFLGLVGLSATHAFTLAITSRVIDMLVVGGGTLLVGSLERHEQADAAAR